MTVHGLLRVLVTVAQESGPVSGLPALARSHGGRPAFDGYRRPQARQGGLGRTREAGVAKE
ncbi:hypothetical protein QFZ22_000717 [Streptomyces canus]|uniref:Uncharacterized protein n=1 Tax=Streptomyces canus TaxID=58343 RepID=A0AAW8F7Q4_9ACTN|nr:hypothetical protein [Streptomyces canus]MDQ0904732.1 hypothetical protein [Streptomyces canus]